MSRTVKYVLIGLSIALVLSLIAYVVVNYQRRQSAQRAWQQRQALSADQASSDMLLERLENLKALREELMLPQIESNLRLY